MGETMLNSLEDVTPAWLTQALSRAERPAVVADVRIEAEVHGTATKALLAVEYHGDGAGLPDRMWLKAGLEPHSPMMGTSGLYAHEARTYLELLRDLQVRRPHCYAADWNDAGQGWLLLEPLANEGQAEIFTPTSSMAVEDVADQIDNLAALHAPTSAQRGFERPAWVKRVFGEHRDPARLMGRLTQPGKLEAMLTQPRCAEYPPEALDPARIVAALDRLAAWLERREPCLLHGDAHIGNTYRSAEGRAGLFDWQIPRWGPGIFDIAYYLVSALAPELRSRHERTLLQRYRDSLRSRGGEAPSEADLWDGYRACLVYGFAAWLANPVELQPENYDAIVSTRFALAMREHSTL